MVEIATIITLICVIVYQGWFIKKQSEHFDAVEKDLLNRIMTRNYETFVQGDVVRAEVKKSLTAEEIAEMQAERESPCEVSMGVFIADAMSPETKDKVKHDELERVLRAMAKEIRTLKDRVTSLEGRK